MKIAYVEKNFQAKTLALIEAVNEVVAKYEALGYSLTLRQVYYQLVAQGIIPNKQAAYGRLGTTVSDGRRAGLISWEGIVDRTRHLKKNPHWSTPAQIVRSALNSYAEDKWRYHTYRVLCVIEKEALAEVLERAASDADVEWFSARGYPSDSAVWRYAQICQRYIKNGQIPVVIHAHDHDPSGLDMGRDISDRLEMFVGQPVEVVRIALNMPQVEEFSLTPNPAKLTDSRIHNYVDQYGTQSWELDALDPVYLATLFTDTIKEYRQRDQAAWDRAVAAENVSVSKLAQMLEGLE